MRKAEHRLAVWILGAAAGVLIVTAAGAAQPRKATATLQIAIHVTASSHHGPHSISGKFTMESLKGAIHLATLDSGRTIIYPNFGATVKYIDGQQVWPFTGSETLISKTGSLSFFFKGDAIIVNPKFNASLGEVEGYDNERATWRITGGTGVYKDWKGGGRMASSDTPSRIEIEWDGLVTK